MNSNEAVLMYTCCVKDGSHCCGEEKNIQTIWRRISDAVIHIPSALSALNIT